MNILLDTNIIILILRTHNITDYLVKLGYPKASVYISVVLPSRVSRFTGDGDISGRKITATTLTKPKK